MKSLKYLNKYFYKYRFRLILGIVITIIARLFSLVTPILIGSSLKIVEQYQNHEISDLGIVKHQLLINVGLILGAVLISGFLTFLMRQTIIVMSRLIEFDLKNEIFQHYELLSLNFYKKNKVGDLMNRISEDVGKVRMYFGPAIMYTINMITLFVIVKRSTIVQEYLSKLTSFVQETFSGINVVKTYGIEKKLFNDFDNLAETSKDKNISLFKAQALFFPLMILLIGISNILVIYIGGMQYIHGEIKHIGVIAEFIIYINMLTWPVAVVGWVTSIVQQAAASQKRINEFLNQETEVKNYVEKETSIKGEIEFKNVTFTYDDTNITALKNVSFKLKQGKTLAILGKTGAGKSTILNLIARLYDIKKGSILVDGIPIKQLNLYNLRNSIGYVPQNSFLFSDTIKNNIKFGNEKANEETIVNAATSAYIHHNIKDFTKEYNTYVGERGVTLSGGQKQRISIARALIHEPEILIFDDCLSAVDTETEEIILTNLSKIIKNKTAIIVSHRVSSAKNADYILVLEDGKIIQNGTHQELLYKDGYFKELYNQQLLEQA